MPRFRAVIAAALFAAAVACLPASAAPVGKVLDINGQVLGITGQVLDIQGRVVDIVGASNTVAGASLGLKGAELGLKATDLGLKATDLGIPGSHVTVAGKEVRIELPADILFDFDKADIRPSAADALKKAAALLRARAKGVVRVEGHTDAKGKPAYNQKLSERRAESVRRWLVEREGLASLQFAIQGFGATRPKVPNTKPDGADDPEGRQINRRVEIVFNTG